ncbi:nitrilase-related carbon-nitrogen hydrolase [Actinomycetospora sp. C-140]
MRITLAQTDAALGDLDGNLKRAERVVGEAVENESDLVVFPELSLSGYQIGEVPQDLSLSPDDPRLLKISERAGDAGVLLGFPEAGGHGLHTYNSAGYYEGGRLVHTHRKLYLPTYSTFEERKHFLPGQHSRAYGVRGGRHRAATLICNDAWQPQVAFLSTQDGAHLLLVPANSAQSMSPERYDSKEYWRNITTFYGRIYQLFVVFVNRVGVEGGLTFWGGSHIVDPWGEVVGECGEGPEAEESCTIDIDLADVRRRRRDIPLVREARLGLLRREIDRLLDEGGDL